MVKVKIDNTTNVYTLYSKNGEELTGRFTSWNNKRATEFTVKNNSLKDFEIIRIDGIVGKNCTNSNNCSCNRTIVVASK